MITLKQVAIAADVHLTTASAVLNASVGNTRVGEATRKRVIKAALRLGYVRNESARRLRTGKSNAVGFIGGDLRNPFFSELASALEQELHLHGLELVLSHVSSTQSTTFSQMVEVFQKQMVNKIIYWDESTSHPNFSFPKICQMFPIGFTTRPRPGIWLDLVCAIERGVSHLAAHNYRQICFFAPSGKTESPSVNIRRKMFLDECRRQNMPPPVCASYQGESWDVEAAIVGVREFLSRNTGTEAYFCFNDVAALGVLLSFADAAQKPVVVCFDGTPLVRHWPRHPLVFDLKIPKLAQMAVNVAIGRRSLYEMGRKVNWLQPQLMV